MNKIGDPTPDNYTVHQELKSEDIKQRPQVDLIQHIPGTLNTSDISTRGHATYQDVAEDSEWINGPSFITKDRSTWPMSRDFIREIPDKEKRSRMFKLINSKQVEIPVAGTLMHLLGSISSYDVLRGIFARLILAHKSGVPPSRSQVLTPELYDEADRVLLWLSMPQSHQLLLDHKLMSLCQVQPPLPCYSLYLNKATPNQI